MLKKFDMITNQLVIVSAAVWIFCTLIAHLTGDGSLDFFAAFWVFFTGQFWWRRGEKILALILFIAGFASLVFLLLKILR